MKIGVIDVGGGMRDIYGSGILDRCLKEGIKFDYGIGVSAGAANITSYKSGQYRRNIPFYTDYSYRPEYMSFRNLLLKGSFIDLDYVYGVLSVRGGENPLDFEAMKASPMKFVIVATDAVTGKAKYFTMDDMKQDDYGPIKCSSCVPIVNRPYRFNGRLYFDGGLSNPIPIRKAFEEEKCDKCVLILTRPRDYLRTSDKDKRRALLLRRKYPGSAKRLERRAALYNRQLDLAQKYEAEGRLLILAPASIEGMGMLKKNKAGSMKLYKMGWDDAKVIKQWLI